MILNRRHLLRNRMNRSAFTLVELLVAAALTVVVMAILATAFQTGMQTFSHLKSVVGLSEQLRSTEAIIRRDLEAVHLETEEGNPVRVSDRRVGSTAWGAPDRGFFEIINVRESNGQPDNLFFDEGAEEGLHSYRVTGHSLAFSAKLPATSRETVFVGNTNGLVNWLTLGDLAPATNISVSPWAELYYFLVPNGLVTNNEFDPTAPAWPLYTLCRRQALLAQDRGPDQPPGTYRNSGLPELSFSTYPRYNPPPAPPSGVGREFLNTPSTITDWRNRMRYRWATNPSGNMPNYPGVTDVQRQTINPTATPNGPRNYWQPPVIAAPPEKIGTEFLLPNVISFQVRPLFGTTYLEELPIANASHATPSGFLNLWDTGVLSNRTADPILRVLRGIQIKLRIYDTKNRMTRQMSINVDL